MSDPVYTIHEGQGPYLLMVHGILSGAIQWKDNLSALAKVCRPVVVELLGHGKSPSPRDPSLYHPERYVGFFETLRQKLGAETWFLLGQSAGAGLTLSYCFAHPERVRAHLMTNSATALGDRAWVAEFQPMFDAIVDDVAREGMAAVERMPIHPRFSRRLDPVLKRELCDLAASHDPYGVAMTMQHTIANSAQGERLHENRVPTMLFCGTGETRFEASRRFAEARMPNLEIVEIDAGHAVAAENPEAFNCAALAYLGRFLPPRLQ